MFRSLVMTALFAMAPVGMSHAADLGEEQNQGELVCEFPYDFDQELGVEELRSFAINEDTELTSLQSWQLVQTARWVTDYSYDIPSTDVATAIQVLRENSEGGDISYIVFRYEGEVYSRIQIYPGGNSSGLVFQGGLAISTISDGDTGCLEQ